MDFAKWSELLLEVQSEVLKKTNPQTLARFSKTNRFSKKFATSE